MLPKPLNTKSEPASTIGRVRDVRRMSDSLMRASLPEHDSRPRIITMRFSAISSRRPSGTAPATLAPSIPPFWTPWAPIARECDAPGLQVQHRLALGAGHQHLGARARGHPHLHAAGGVRG